MLHKSITDINFAKLNHQKMEGIDILHVFGDNVRKYRCLEGISQEELGYRAGLHRTYIGMIERAEKNITLLNMEKIANALNVEISQLLEFHQ